MGVKMLNSFLRQNIPQAQNSTYLSIASGKRLVVDTSIYMYEFTRQNRPIEEGFQCMIHMFDIYQIQAVFVFDGKAPVEKQSTIRLRATQRQQAIQEYLKLQESIEKGVEVLTDSMQIHMKELKEQTASVSISDVNNLKRWMDAHKQIYMVAEEEADVVCAKMVRDGRAWGCLSNDTDMFLYGCPRILSGVQWWDEEDKKQGSCTFIELSNVLHTLGMDYGSFLQMVVLAGTECNPHIPNIHIYKLYQNWPKYIAYVQKYYYVKIGPVVPFYIWYQKYTKLDDAHNGELFAKHIDTYHKIMRMHTQPISTENACLCE